LTKTLETSEVASRAGGGYQQLCSTREGTTLVEEPTYQYCLPSVGGERILDVFEIKLKEAIQKLPFQKILTLKNVQNVVNEADG
jgi:hypothetical protein